MIRIGAQVSVAGGMQQTLEEAEQMGLDCLQIFSRSPVGGQSRGLPQSKQMAQWLAGAQIRPLFVHAPYFVNPAATDEVMHAKACQVLGDEMRRVRHLAGDFLVVHPGHQQTGASSIEALDAFADTVISLLTARGRVLIENTAGQGKEVGSSFEDLARVFNAVGKTSRVGLMLDTAHAMAWGYPLTTANDWKLLCSLIDENIGLARVRGVHLNDSLFPIGSRRDQHAALLTGYFGSKALQDIVATADEYNWPLILETPGKNAAARAADLAILRNIIAGL
ncbi:MAG: endonuclease IV [Sulfobacillus benefaciens]|uniref:Endonuclease IV n=1 Tax=Sulfobacillus benefaciens TaxID=453960 RepID=A0A2T2XLV2_9FIRM|nr:MAG: endonuclease IV [Sulfobacillus benefaciens]